MLSPGLHTLVVLVCRLCFVCSKQILSVWPLMSVASQCLRTTVCIDNHLSRTILEM